MSCTMNLTRGDLILVHLLRSLQCTHDGMLHLGQKKRCQPLAEGKLCSKLVAFGVVCTNLLRTPELPNFGRNPSIIRLIRPPHVLNSLGKRKEPTGTRMMHNIGSKYYITLFQPFHFRLIRLQEGLHSTGLYHSKVLPTTCLYALFG
jgi:hypothetical protein